MNTWVWCNVFSLNCRIPTLRPTPPVKDYNELNTVNQLEREQLLRALRNSLCGSNGSIVPEVDLNSLDVPTLSPSDKKELEEKILKMSKLKREYELDEMKKKIEKNKHNLKRVNVSISLSKDNSPNFVKKVEQCKSQLPELEHRIKEEPTDKLFLYIHKQLGDLKKIEDRMTKYQVLLDKQKGLMTRQLALQYNLTYFETVLHR